MTNYTIFGNNDIEKILNVVREEVECAFDDADEIGSSDISCTVRSICNQLTNVSFDEIPQMEKDIVRNAVRNCL